MRVGHLAQAWQLELAYPHRFGNTSDNRCIGLYDIDCPKGNKIPDIKTSKLALTSCNRDACCRPDFCRSLRILRTYGLFKPIEIFIFNGPAKLFRFGYT